MSNRIMTHMVAWFPNRESSLEVARGMVDGGSAYLEVQFPFSDPTADGYHIQEACKRALAEGFTVSRGFDLVREIIVHADIPVFIMCYANTIFVYGVRRFLQRCKAVGVRGVIVPDLPVDYDEGLYSLCEEAGIQAVPVVSPSTSDSRLRMILSNDMEYVYATLRKGITGSFTEVHDSQLGFLKRVRSHRKKVLAGFGISERNQVEAIAPYIHAAVVGTGLVKAVMNDSTGNVYDTVRRKMASLTLIPY
jgi:tryptophan synthase alpha chain